MLLKEKFMGSGLFCSFESELFRIDPGTKQPIRVCRVVYRMRMPFSTAPMYDIDLFASEAGHGVVQNSGNGNKLNLSINGRRAAEKRSSSNFFDNKYDITIAPETDVLLFLGIACATERIEKEVDKRNQRGSS